MGYQEICGSTLCDNNLLALPVKLQEHILQRDAATSTPLRDANAGFEPQIFDAGTYPRWNGVMRGPGVSGSTPSARALFLK